MKHNPPNHHSDHLGQITISRMLIADRSPLNRIQQSAASKRQRDFTTEQLIQSIVQAAYRVAS